MGRRARAGKTKILHTQYTLHSHAKGTDFGTSKQEACLLNPNQIPELIMDGESDEPLCDVVATEDEEFHENVLLEPHLQSQSEYTACSSAQAPLNPDSASTSKDDDDQIGIDPQKREPPKLQWTLPLPTAECSTHTFTAGRRRKNDNEAPHINGSFMPLKKEFLYCNSQRLSYCLLWRLTDIIIGAWTV